MKDASDIIIRMVKASDGKKLTNFFIKTYGERTIFRNEKFISYFFDFENTKLGPMSSCMVGISPDGEIVSHYGGLFSELKLADEIVPMIWGVNAFTLPEWRARGINSKMTSLIVENNEVNGVIGFSGETGSFYRAMGYNLFCFERFVRYVYVIDHCRTLEVARAIGRDGSKLNKSLHARDFRESHSGRPEIIELTKDNIGSYELNWKLDLFCTTHRSARFLNWRLLRNPYVEYAVYGFLENGSVVAYIALREEIVQPYNYRLAKIVDVYGKKAAVTALLSKAIRESILRNHIYIDFAMFGKIYENELISVGFSRLENDDYCILPQALSPVENRPNREFIGLQSKTRSSVINRLTRDDVYFTRIDSDRDRLNRIDQIAKRTGGLD